MCINLGRSLWLLHIRIPFGAQIIAGRITVIPWQRHLQQWHLILHVAGAEHLHSIWRGAAISMHKRWRRRSSDQQLFPQATASTAGYILRWCRVQTAMTRWWTVRTVRLHEGPAGFVGHTMMVGGSFPCCGIAQFAMPMIRSATFEIVIVIAGCATVFVIHADCRKFDRNFFVVRIVTVNGSVLFFGAHFIKILKYSHDRKLNGAYRHYLFRCWRSAFQRWNGRTSSGVWFHSLIVNFCSFYFIITKIYNKLVFWMSFNYVHFQFSVLSFWEQFVLFFFFYFFHSTNN